MARSTEPVFAIKASVLSSGGASSRGSAFHAEFTWRGRTRP
jgi:hypothetical protein